MIEFRASLANPFRCGTFKNYYVCGGHLAGNKSWEFQVSCYPYNLFAIEASLACSGIALAGPMIELTVFGYAVAIRVTDNRHWNYSKHCWEE